MSDATSETTAGGSLTIATTLQVYLAARTAQQRDHTDASLNDARAAAHDELLWALRMGGVEFAGRADGVRVAMEIVR